jgi:hypothetical protein
MPDPERLLATLRRAVSAIRQAPGRHGRLIRLTSGDDLLLAGDLHGNLENFRKLLQIADLGNHPGRHFVLQELVHGGFTYPAGGDRSHQLVDLTAALMCQFPGRVHYLLGNHELSQATGRRIAKLDHDLNQDFDAGVATAYGERAADVLAAYRELWAVQPVAVRTPNRVFLSHSLPPESRLESFDLAALEREPSEEVDLLPKGSVHSLVWGRDTRPSTAQAFLKKVDADWLLTGHIPCDAGWEAPNDAQLILDSLGFPAAYCLFPLDRPLTHAGLKECVKTL